MSKTFSLMRCLFAFLVSAILIDDIYAQSAHITPTPNYDYDGVYEYIQPDTIELAASPIDGQLYAIIGEEKYQLRNRAEDLFFNGSGDSVAFKRNAQGEVTAFHVYGREFKILRRTSRPRQYWHARIENSGSNALSKIPIVPNDKFNVISIEQSGLNRQQLTDMIKKITAGTYHDIHGVLLSKNGNLVLEEYFFDYDHERLHQLRSATKSFVSALVGIALQQKLIRSIDDPVLSFFKDEYTFVNGHEWKNKITLRHLLNNQAGWDCDIDIDSSAGNETVMGNSADWVKFTLDLPMLEEPGTKGRYCSGNVIVLGRILEKVSGKPLAEFAKENLFEPLGIKHFKWHFKPDPSSASTFCQLYLRPRDMLKFGMMYLNKGRHQGKQVVPESWVAASMTKVSKIDDSDYGYLWWKPYLNVEGERVEGVAAKGNGGQRIFLFPQYKLAVVITGGSYNRQSTSDALLIHHILPGLK